ncbi:MAG: DUF2065 domain-containing protein [Alphaproteobacteria bacterium]|nr:DUF2065 domain-containing protein [Alphaproteobacteria bacterium]
MESLFHHLLIAFALVFVIEGLIYAAFPAQVQNMMKMASEFDAHKFRYFGAATMSLGILAVWLIFKF